jgi:hypothetical protein
LSSLGDELDAFCIGRQESFGVRIEFYGLNKCFSKSSVLRLGSQPKVLFGDGEIIRKWGAVAGSGVQ